MTDILDSIADDLQRVRLAVSRDGKQPAALRCILVERVGDVVRTVATDRHRLMVTERTLEGHGALRAFVDPDSLEFATGVADEFPDYERFLAADSSATTATVAAGELLAAVEANVDDDAPLAVEVADGAVRVGDDVGSPTLHVDAGYLHDAVGAAGSEQVTVEASGPTAPLAIRSPGLVSLVMPVRIRN